MKLEDAMNNIYATDGILHLASRDRHEKLKTILSVPFDPDLHYTLAYIHLHYAMLEIGIEILEHTPNKEDETYKRLKDFYDALCECQRSNVGIFPLFVSFRNWWNEPHLKFPNPEKITEWFPLKLDWIEGNKLHCTVAKREFDEILYGEVEFSSEKTLSEPEENLMGEIAFYGDDYLIQFHREKVWNYDEYMKILVDRAKPFIISSNENLQRQLDSYYAKD